MKKIIHLVRFRDNPGKSPIHCISYWFSSNPCSTIRSGKQRVLCGWIGTRFANCRGSAGARQRNGSGFFNKENPEHFAGSKLPEPIFGAKFSADCGTEGHASGKLGGNPITRGLLRET